MAARGDTVGRFSNVVGNYVKYVRRCFLVLTLTLVFFTVGAYRRYRPSYPPEVFDLLRREGVTTEHLVADVGAGTGIFTRMLVEQGFRVVSVEPNDEMRKGTSPPACKVVPA